ncbi:MAG: F0F1 ATP synthase subunit B [Anaerolineae bacterium]
MDALQGALQSLGILWWNLVFQIANFLVVLWLLNRFLYKPIMKMLSERRETIAAGLAEAESVREEADAQRVQFEQQLAEERRASQERLRDAVAKSEEAARQRLVEANAEAEQIVSRARSEAEEARTQALSGLHAEIADLALLAAAKALGDGLDDVRHRALINKFLDEELGELA